MVLGLGLASMFGALAWTSHVQADDAAPSGAPTFYKDVLPILQTNCQVCHRPSGANMGGMVAPMAFTSYAEVRPWAKSIALQVSQRTMPPWHAAAEFNGIFANERTLTDAEIGTIVRWVETGALPGNPADAPAPLAFSESEWGLGEPDLVLEMPEPFFVADEVEDVQPNISMVIPEELLPEDRWIKAMEFKPGSPVVHHIIGYAYLGQGDGLNTRGHLGGIAPGNDPESWPEGYGILLPKGSTFTFAMHYHKEKGPGTGTWDRSRVAFQFYPKGAKVRPVQTNPIGNRAFEIPPHHPDWTVGMARVFEKDTEILFLMPHMHMRGKAAQYVAYYPDGTSETLLRVDRYDFNWQTSYAYREPKLIPAGTRLEVTMRFDNSTANPSNPDPEKAVRFGGPTTDEMALGWLSYVERDLASASE